MSSSSVYGIPTCNRRISCIKSFTKALNKGGDRMHPGLSPVCTLNQSLCTPFNLTVHFTLLYNDFNALNIFLSIPIFDNLCHSNVLSILSYACQKSIKVAKVFIFFLILVSTIKDRVLYQYSTSPGTILFITYAVIYCKRNRHNKYETIH